MIIKILRCKEVDRSSKGFVTEKWKETTKTLVYWGIARISRVIYLFHLIKRVILEAGRNINATRK